MQLRRVDHSFEPVLVNLLELYMHDMSEWFHVLPDSTGRFGFVVHDHFARGAPVYIAFDGDTPVGFALVDDSVANADYDMEEFFLMRSHRHRGIAEDFARGIWEQLPGRWLVRVLEGNLPAVPFWRRVITDGYQATEQHQRLNDAPWIVFRFTVPG